MSLPFGVTSCLILCMLGLKSNYPHARVRDPVDAVRAFPGIVREPNPICIRIDIQTLGQFVHFAADLRHRAGRCPGDIGAFRKHLAIHPRHERASSPVTAWRNLTFNDSGTRWSSSPAPFHFGESLNIGTLLSDMRNVYTCVFLRQTFTVTNKQEVNALVLDVKYDDGFIAWINGTEVARALVTNTTYTSTASGSHEATSTVSFTNVFPSYLANGSNILAIQAFNGTIGSSDFRIDAAVRVTRDGSRPGISSLSPQSGSFVSSLASIAVTFSEAVFGVDASDLLINDLPATGMTGGPGTNTWVFTFPQPVAGQVNFGWVEAHGITDSSGNPFDSEAASASWSCNLVDTVGPRVVSLAPRAGAQVNRLAQVQVLFDEPVSGVTAGDLLINSVPATNVVGAETGPYVFSFPEPSPGTVAFAWAGGHGIRDLSPASNAFAGSGWSVNLNPAGAAANLVISEFLAENTAANHPLDVDEDGELQDWIEIQNRGAAAVDLLGWSLTDDRDVPNKWVFPSLALNPGEFVLVYASEKDRRPAGGGSPLHTNFKLNPFGEYLALLSPEFPPRAATEFTNQYPEQRKDFSFGLDRPTAGAISKPPLRLPPMATV